MRVTCVRVTGTSVAIFLHAGEQRHAVERLFRSGKFAIKRRDVDDDALGIKPGEKLHAIEYRGRIELVPVRPTKTARGSLKGIDTDVPRESDRV